MPAAPERGEGKLSVLSLWLIAKALHVSPTQSQRKPERWDAVFEPYRQPE